MKPKKWGNVRITLSSFAEKSLSTYEQVRHNDVGAGFEPASSAQVRGG
jgi:hypothetical protein